MPSASLQCWLWIIMHFLLSSSSMPTARKIVPAIIVFGDSTVDPGNNNNILTIARANFPPYGCDFDGGVATGRFSNGRLIPDFISEELGLASSVPAYLGSTIDQLAAGVSFASAGSGLDDLTATTVSVIPMSQQLEYFKEYKEALKLTKGAAAADDIIAEALYAFSVGTNDFILNYFALPLRRAQYTTPEYVAELVGLADAAVRAAYELGARKVLFTGLGPFGCVPAARTTNHGAPGECNEEFNRAALAFNAELRAAVGRLAGELAGARVVYADVYGVAAAIIADPSEHGFENAAEGCCGTGHIELAVLCAVDEALTCQDADKYVFFDSVHPSQRMYRILANDTISTALQVFL